MSLEDQLQDGGPTSDWFDAECARLKGRNAYWKHRAMVLERQLAAAMKANSSFARDHPGQTSVAPLPSFAARAEAELVARNLAKPLTPRV